MRSNSTIPSYWQYADLEKIADINPKFDKTKYSDELEVSFIPMKRVSELTGIVDLSETRKFGEVKKGYTPFQTGDIIFAKITPCMENGKVAMLSGLLNEIGFGSTEFHVLRLPNYMPRKYLFYYLVQENFRRDAERNMTGSVGQKRVPADFLKQTSIPLPPLQEQHRIVNKIEELFTKLDAGVEAMKQVQAQLKRYRQSVLKAAIEGRLTAEWREQHKDELEPADKLIERIQEERKAKIGNKYKDPILVDTNDLPELPERWKWATLGQITEDAQIGIVRSKREQNTHGEGIAYLKMNNVTTDGRILFDDMVFVQADDEEKTRYSIRKGDILFNTRNSIELVGKTGIIRENVDEVIYNNNLMRIRTAKGIVSLFILHQICASGFRKRMEKFKRATTNVAAIYAKDLMPLPLAIPSLEEQVILTSSLERIFSIVEDIEKVLELELKRAQSLRQSILKRAFEGKLVSQDPNEEPASVLLERIKTEKAKPKKSKQLEII